MTNKEADDGSRVGPLLDRIDGPVASFAGDDVFHRADVHAKVAARHPEAAVVVPPRSSAVPSDTAEIMPTQRDAHLRCIAERGRMGWQRASGYDWRALVESDIARWKRIIGGGLRPRTDGRQRTEVAIAADALNRMLDLGRPEYVRVAWRGTRVGRHVTARPTRATQRRRRRTAPGRRGKPGTGRRPS